MSNTKYHRFIASKHRSAQAHGIDDGYELSPKLFEFQRDMTSWALRMGRAALFEDCGLGKSWQAIEWARVVSEHTGKPVLILTPLSVASQFVDEGRKLGVDVQHLREGREWQGVAVTNYERLHKFDSLISGLGGVVLDESSILKASDGKTRTMIIDSFSNTPFRLACTATPAPNDHVELANHAEFLGVMKREEMLATYFVHDGGDTSKWRLKGHAEKDFWAWVCSWAVCISSPRDLGYDSDGYDLPPLNMHEHVVDVDQQMARNAGLLFAYEATTLSDQRAVRRGSLDERVRVAANLCNTSDRQWLVWCELNDESDALVKAIPDAVEIKGADSGDQKEQTMARFLSGDARVLVSKPSICGFGVNMQCVGDQVFVGAGHSFEQWYQAVRRSWRFGRESEVNVHVISTSADGRVVANLKRKQTDAQTMMREMVAAMTDVTKKKATRKTRAKVELTTVGGTGWDVTLGDCVDVVGAMPDASVDFSVYSPPFSSLYVYSDSDRDMGNSRSDEEFFEHYQFLLGEMLRVTKPGRLSAVHCMTLPTTKTRDGFIGLKDFPGAIVKAHEAAGWIYHSKVTIWKDPVTAMQRTKAIGLLHKQLKKDSTISRQGIPDEVLAFRAPGDNPEPVSHSNESFPVDQWQRYASPVWMDINPSDTLQYMSAREDKDERHICPLQLEVIRRCLRLWSNPGDLVLSPFTGIGSEGYVALHEGRRFVGAELKPSYHQQACANLKAASERPRELFAFGT